MEAGKFRINAEDISMIGGIATVSLLHSFIPIHWLPFSIVGASRNGRSLILSSMIMVMTSLVSLSFYGASQLEFHWVDKRYDKLLVGSVLCLVGLLTLIFHDHDGDAGQHQHRKLIFL